MRQLPLVQNGAQLNNGDHDEVGDDCDPRPTDDGDCLVLLDRFTEPDALAANWLFVTEPGDRPANIVATPAAVTITPNGSYAVGMIARDLTGSFAVHVSATLEQLTGTMSFVAAVSHATGLDTYFGCGFATSRGASRHRLAVYVELSVITALGALAIAGAIVGPDRSRFLLLHLHNGVALVVSLWRRKRPRRSRAASATLSAIGVAADPFARELARRLAARARTAPARRR